MHYQRHIFFCTNKRDNGKKCCEDANASDMRQYMKKRLQALNLHGVSQLRVNTAGCMGRCKDGPALVIYPDGVWYSYKDQHDIDEIIESHLLQGKKVTSLLLTCGLANPP